MLVVVVVACRAVLLLRLAFLSIRRWLVALAGIVVRCMVRYIVVLCIAVLLCKVPLNTVVALRNTVVARDTAFRCMVVFLLLSIVVEVFRTAGIQQLYIVAV